MGRIKFDTELIRSVSRIQEITRVPVRDCIDLEGQFLVIVEEGKAAKAIGKKGANVRRLENDFNRKIKIIEFNPEPSQFIRNLVAPQKVNDVVIDGEVMTLTPADTKTRGQLIGRSGSNLRTLESIIKRYFPIKEIKVARDHNG